MMQRPHFVQLFLVFGLQSFMFLLMSGIYFGCVRACVCVFGSFSRNLIGFLLLG